MKSCNTLLFLIIFLCVLPACKRIQLKPLPLIPERYEASVHVDAHLLTSQQEKNFLGLSKKTTASFDAWHMVIYNPTPETLKLTKASWSLNPYKAKEIYNFVASQYEDNFFPINIIACGTGAVGLYSLIALAPTIFPLCTAVCITPILLPISVMSIITFGGFAGINLALFSIPLANIYSTEANTNHHYTAIQQQLLNSETTIPAHSTIQGIILLPSLSLQQWNLKIFGENKTYNFAFNKKNIHE